MSLFILRYKLSLLWSIGGLQVGYAFFFFLVSGTGVPLRNPVLARQLLCHLSHHPHPFISGYLLDRVLPYTWTGLDHNPPTSVSPSTGITGMYHHAQLVVEMGCCELFAGLGSNHGLPNSHLPSS
jgi:hypothetical protein